MHYEDKRSPARISLSPSAQPVVPAYPQQDLTRTPQKQKNNKDTQTLHVLTMSKYILQNRLPKTSIEDSSVVILSVSGIDNKAYEGPLSVDPQRPHSDALEIEYGIEPPVQRSVRGDTAQDRISGGCRVSLDPAPASNGCQDALSSQKDLEDGQKHLEITCQVSCRPRNF